MVTPAGVGDDVTFQTKDINVVLPHFVLFHCNSYRKCMHVMHVLRQIFRHVKESAWVAAPLNSFMWVAPCN